MIKKINFRNFRKFKNNIEIDFSDSKKNIINVVNGLTGFSSSGKTTILSYFEFIPVLWNMNAHYMQFVKTSVLTEVLQDYKKKNKNFLEKYKTPISFNQSDEFKIKFSEMIESEKTSKEFLKCNLFKLNLNKKNEPFISETSYSLSNNDYVLHRITLDLTNDSIKEVFLLNGNEKLDSSESRLSQFKSKINSVFEKLNEKLISFINLSNLSKSRIAFDEQNRRLFEIKIKDEHQKLFQLFINLFDPNIKSINYQSNTPITYVIGDNKEVISFNDLSTGTRKAIYLWAQLYSILILKLNDSKFFFVYDEIQDNWNLTLIDLIFHIFNNKNINPKNSQLFFSTHNPVIMENFSNDKIFLINDNKVFRADNLEIKNNQNFSNAYLYDKLVKNNYKTWLNEFIDELNKIN